MDDNRRLMGGIYQILNPLRALDQIDSLELERDELIEQLRQTKSALVTARTVIAKEKGY